MKKMLVVFFSLIIIYILLQIFFLGKNHNISYTIKNDDKEFKVKEQYSKGIYYIEIKTDNNAFAYELNNGYNQKNLKDIKYYKDDEIECLLPIFVKNDIVFDLACNIEGNMIYYHNMRQKNNDLIDFVASLKDIYDETKFVDNQDAYVEQDIYKIYMDNLIKNHYLSITNYQGIININNKKIENVNIFSQDKYSRPLSYFVNNYYIVADYNSTYEFNKFYVVNIKTNTLKELKDYYNISFDSYIQGIVKNSLYLFDLDNKIQYEINPKNLIIKKIGNVKKDIKYYDGSWSKIKANEAIKNKIIFKTDQREILENGNIIDKINNEETIYTYVKNNKGYSLYKSNTKNPEIKKYLFDLNDINSVIYIDNYIYYKDDNSINYYSEETGKRKIIESKELLFNSNILYKVTK